ncbi:MAG: helix-turn-helix domain-containing protein [Lautropia sp.]
MNHLRQIQRGIDFIEAHLSEDFRTADVARHAFASHWHFQRTFKALTNETLKHYIRARRLANALVSLDAREHPILEIALASGFGSQAAFTRAFRRAFDTTPGAYRTMGKRTQFVRKLRIDDDYLRHLRGGVSLVPSFVKRPAMTMVGLRTHFFGVESDKSNMGDRLPPLWNAFLERVDEVVAIDPGVRADALYGVVIPTPGREQLDYLAGALVPHRARAPTGMLAVTMGEQTYAEFVHRGLPKDLNRTVNYIYANWLLTSGMKHTYGPDLEIYGSDYVPDSPDSVIRYAIPVRGRAKRSAAIG